MDYKSETKTHSASSVQVCQNCKNDFVIESEDFSFYEKIKVPPPTFCPECRFKRRQIWRNEKSLYKRQCDSCYNSIIAVYDSSSKFPVYCPKCYRSDSWDATIYAKEYDFSKPFFEQFHDLLNKVPRQSLRQIGDCANSEYANLIDSSKNVYLSSSVIWGAEYVYYSNIVDGSKQIIDSYNVTASELLYENIGVEKNYNCKYAYWSSSCIDSNFMLNCVNCQNCFGCVNLRNQNYCIWNQQYTKEKYFEILKELDLGSYNTVEKVKKDFLNFALKFPRKYAKNTNTENCTGDELRNCKNVHFGFNCYGTENAKYSVRSANSKDIMDSDYIAAEMCYEHALGGSKSSQNIKFIIDGQPGCNNLEYVDNCQSSSDLFGCIGLKNKQYCILNKQYSKEEYFNMVQKIKQHMTDMPYVSEKGLVYQYGEFFPNDICPFGYNESVVNDYFNLSKDEILEFGYAFKEKPEAHYKITKKAQDLSDNIKDVDDSILNEIIECAESGRAFKITQYELQLYKKMNIPLPRLHPDVRSINRLKLKNPIKLWHRKCMKSGCQNEFETSYAPDRPEIVYCEKCYQREVY